MNNDIHPVWSVYDLYRTSRLNVKYYSVKLYRVEQEIFWMDLVLLICAPGSSVAGFWFFQNPIGAYVWKILGAIAAIVAILKPLLNRTKKLKIYEELRTSYRALEHDLETIKEKILLQKQYDVGLQQEFKNALERVGILKGKETDSKHNKKLIRNCYDEVLSELPKDKFFVPED